MSPPGVRSVVMECPRRLSVNVSPRCAIPWPVVPPRDGLGRRHFGQIHPLLPGFEISLRLDPRHPYPLQPAPYHLDRERVGMHDTNHNHSSCALPDKEAVGDDEAAPLRRCPGRGEHLHLLQYSVRRLLLLHASKPKANLVVRLATTDRKIARSGIVPPPCARSPLEHRTWVGGLLRLRDNEFPYRAILAVSIGLPWATAIL